MKSRPMKKKAEFILCLSFGLFLVSCAGAEKTGQQVSDTATEAVVSEITAEPAAVEEPTCSPSPEPTFEPTAEPTEEPQDILHFVDVFGEEYEVEIDRSLPENPYRKECFVNTGGILTYEDENYISELGVDVSHHQGTVDWVKLKEAGVSFAFLRIGYRGYGQAGTLNADREFENNIRGAQEAGIKVGVYFFAQAVNEEEALEEAEYTLKLLGDHTLELPVVYDPESILDAEARTDHVTREQFTANTVAYCERIKEAGLKPMIYSNMLWEAYELNLSELTDYPIWYADYEPLPQTPYHFVCWQYTNEGKIPGITGNADLDILLIQK